MLLREHRARAVGVADLLLWAFMVDDGIILQKDGSFLAGWRYRGPDTAAASEAELYALASHVNDALLPYGDNWMFHVDAVRRPAAPYAAGPFPSAIPAMIDEERRAAYVGSGARLETEYMLTATYRPPPEALARFSRWFLRGAAPRERHPSRADWDAVLDGFRTALETMASRLGSRLALERLSSDALCTHLHRCLTGVDHAIRTPAGGAYLNLTLASQDLVGGFEPRMGAHAVRIVAVHGFPPMSEPGALAFLSELRFACRWSTRVIPLGTQTAAALIRRHQLRWFQKRKGAGAWLKDMAASQSSAPKPPSATDEAFQDHDAVRMVRDAADALADNAAGDIRFCAVTQTVVFMHRDHAEARRLAEAVLTRLGDRGYTGRVETVNAVEAFLGSLPGHGYPNVRRTLLSSRNVADLLPLTSVWPGLAHNPSPYFPAKSPPLLWAATQGSTPFRVNLHDSDVGHTLILGRTGAGKSTLVGTLIAQWQRYPDAQAFVFDVGYSNWLLCHAADGEHYDVGAALRAEGEADLDVGSLHPLARIDEPVERVWATEWVETVVALQGVTVTPPLRERIDRALTLVAGNPPAHRTLTELAVQVQHAELAQALRPYTMAGPYGFLLDGAGTATDADAAYQVFELKALFEMGDALLVPALLALFRRVERRLDGRPTLIVIEELWAPLLRSTFAAKVKQWLLTLRKQNAAVVLVAHSPAQLDEVPNARLLWESCPTRFYLPNPDAVAPDAQAVYTRLGLTPREVDTIARAVPKREYYFSSPRGARLFELGLGPLALAFVGSPDGMSADDVRRRVSALMIEHGADWPAAWLAERGLSSWAARYREWHRHHGRIRPNPLTGVAA